MDIIDKIGQSDRASQWQEQMKTNSRQLITGLSGSAKTLLIANAFIRKKKKIVVVVPNLYYGNQLVEDLRNVLSEKEVYFFPVDEVLSVEMAFSSPESRAERVTALDFLVSNQLGIVVVTVAGLRKYLPQKDTWIEAHINLEIGQEMNLNELAENLVLMGYERQSLVSKPGDFSIRGSIVDIYPLNDVYPVRAEFFDIEIDSLRQFMPDTQRSLKVIDKITISPMTETIFSPIDFKNGVDKTTDLVEKRISILKEKEQKEYVQDYFGQLITDWQNKIPTENMSYYADILYKDKATLLDYLPEDSLFFIDDYARILETEREIIREANEWHVLKLSELLVFPEQDFGADFHEQIRNTQLATTFFSLFQKGMGNLKFQAIHNFQYRSMQQFFGQMPLLKSEMDRWQKQSQTVVVFVPTKERSKKVEELFRDFDIQSVNVSNNQLIDGTIQIVFGDLQTGFELPTEKLVVITEKEIFQTAIKKRARKQTISNAERLKSYSDLKTGDYVVHANHGIGKYIGMQTLEVDGRHQDYMTILYQNNDKLFIPVTQLDLIQKFVAAESKTPRVNKLGGSEWSKTKRKVSSKIEDIADDLIKLYADREAEKGFAFPPDDTYQKEFEEAFPYGETEDQLRSTAEIKQDMEKVKPMDRLLVGDVGFGKTEVALRAAFKAINANKQVAFLVPTTILAQQHYETMLDRFEGFPVEVGLLSRFRTKRQQAETIEKIEHGQIDIVVGTHRILSQDIHFSDLGLLIIDEEQRFGVKHKERLKQLRAQVDVLTLTATPIPRTLHMSMLGVRDLSIIETPPENRYPIQTYVMENNSGAIKEAVERELARGGQVFYLYNRVDTIEQKVEELKNLVPDAKIAYAHGQMTEVQLENTLFDFIERQYDILVTTTIIETGVDIPNANTLFVENADYMGLSTLYQLRGRVGRSNRIAYAYFMYERQKILNEVSEKRLEAIKDFTELGSGFKIAMRDLSIRGAGNLLGAQQHGFIDSVGFDMYSQMLSEAVARKKGLPQDKKTMVEIDLGVDAYLPNTYIDDERQKIEIYKRIRQLEDMEMYDELEADILDRFGEYPDEVAHLLTIGKIKMDGERALIETIRKKNQEIIFILSKLGTNTYTIEQIFSALSFTNMKADLAVENEKMMIRLKIDPDVKEAIWLQEVATFIASLRKEKYQSMGSK